jgi:hypothetical protein
MLSRAVEHGDLKSAAAELTHVPDEVLKRVALASRVERARIAEESAL